MFCFVRVNIENVEKRSHRRWSSSWPFVWTSLAFSLRVCIVFCDDDDAMTHQWRKKWLGLVIVRKENRPTSSSPLISDFTSAGEVELSKTSSLPFDWPSHQDCWFDDRMKRKYNCFVHRARMLFVWYWTNISRVNVFNFLFLFDLSCQCQCIDHQHWTRRLLLLLSKWRRQQKDTWRLYYRTIQQWKERGAQPRMRTITGGCEHFLLGQSEHEKREREKWTQTNQKQTNHGGALI